MTLNRLILFLIVFLYSCKGGFISPGVGETDKFASLVDRMNEMAFMSQINLNVGTNEGSYAKFEVSGIVSIDQIGLNTGVFSIPEHNLEKEFNKAEILRVYSDITNEQGEFIARITITYLIATKDVFFSEADGDIKEMFYVAQIPENIVFSNRLDIAFETDEEGYYDTVYNGKLTTVNERVNYSFDGLGFLYVDLINGRPLARVLGFGEILSDKETVGS
ncbi:MAG: hypothetical protein JJ892_00755 [Balneola sp.]|nr:hypothetical protein [Balneola sp.]MBO6650800.1 hypothetical protein [Balneola sp.]MBO6710091.1 hypothetical protein [Balneola sp.]MBO6798775.1 hypothetical protein [Balneola sp.]MBO6869889.1 hypothetical protein [Balneola sp.]